MRGPTTAVWVLSGLLLSGCDFYVVRPIGLAPGKPYQPEEANAALRNDFERVTQVVERLALADEFEEVVPEREPLRRVYQKNAGDKVFRITITGFPPYQGITVAVFEMQTRRRSAALDQLYAALGGNLRAAFGDRIAIDEGDAGRR